MTLAGSSMLSAQVIDGVRDAAYGEPVAVQDTSTQFGDSNLGVATWANGSEINGLFAMRDSQNLYLFIPMNLETNYNKLEIFFDTGTGLGENRLLPGQSSANFGGLSRMAEDNATTMNGMTFDVGFTANYWMNATCGSSDNAFGMFPDFAPIGATRYNDAYLGRHNGGITGLAGGNARNIEVGFDNSNTQGVFGGAGLDTNGATGLQTGYEVKIPLEKLGYPSGPIKVIAMVNGSSHDFLSNQVIPGIGGGGNFGEPRNVNFANVTGDQFATISGSTVDTISGLVDFDGKVPSALEIEVRDATTQNLVGNYIVHVGRDGRYELGLPSAPAGGGGFDLIMKPAGYLRRKVSFLPGPDSNFALVNGNIDGDEAITVFDYDILSTFFDQTSVDLDWNTVGESGFAPSAADIDLDGAVTVFDYDILSRNFDRSDD